MPTRITAFARLPLALALAGLMASPLTWAIEIEQRPLSTYSAPAVVPPKPVTAPAVAVAAPAAVAAVAARTVPQVANPAWDMFQQIEEMRTTVAKLQGTVEEQQQLIERLQSDLRTRYTDLDQRLEQITKPALPAPLPEVAPVTPTPAAKTEVVPVATTVPVPAPASTVIPSKPTVELTPEEVERQKSAYLAAYQSFRRDGAAPAITAMTSFLNAYPDSVFAPNAYYWLGEFQLALEPVNFVKAEANFQRVLRDYSASPKVPAAYYKLGSIADLQGNRKVARDWMTRLLTEFPGSPESRLAQSFLDQNPAAAAR